MHFFKRLILVTLSIGILFILLLMMQHEAFVLGKSERATLSCAFIMDICLIGNVEENGLLL